MSAIAAKNKYDRAIARITELDELRRKAPESIAAIRQTGLLSEQEKQRRIDELREETLAAYRTGSAEVRALLEEADNTAHRVLSGDPDDTALEARKSRAGSRVARLLDSGVPVASAAEIFAEAGDVDAMRALRDEIPSIVGSADPTDRLGARERAQHVRALTISLDSMMAPLLPEAEAHAARLRGNIDTAQDWVKDLGEDTIRAVNDQADLDRSVFYRDQLAAT